MDHIGTQGGTSEVPIPLAALRGNECFSPSLRLCFSNDVSWLDDWSLDHTDKNFGPDLPLLFDRMTVHLLPMTIQETFYIGSFIVTFIDL